MTETLYLNDCYKKEAVATVLSVNGKFIVLDRSIFYPESGGQPTDTGWLVCDDEKYDVLFAKKIAGEISLEVDREGLKAGDNVTCEIDWNRRYLFMRYHTAAHILSTIIHNETGAEITGNQITAEKTRVDFNLENFDREQIKGYEGKANEIIKKAIPVKTSFLPREEAFRIPSLVKLKMMLPESIQTIRVVDIGGFDKQACGGTHIANTSEIRGIEIINAENKGKNNRRIYFKIID